MHKACRTNAPTHLRAYNDKEPARAASHSAMAGARVLTVTQHRHALTRPPRRDVRPPEDSGGATICSLQQTACREQGHFLPYARCQLNSTTMTAWEARYQPSVPTPATLAKLRPGSSAMDQMDAGQHHSFSFGQLCTHTHTHTHLLQMLIMHSMPYSVCGGSTPRCVDPLTHGAATVSMEDK